MMILDIRHSKGALSRTATVLVLASILSRIS
jgi:hypothetical protein